MTRLRDILSRGLRSILARPGRTALTAFGIGVGVAAALQLAGPSSLGGPAQRRVPPRRIPRLMVSNGERASLASVFSATPERARRAGLVAVEGRSLADLDVRDARRVAVIGAGLRAELFGFQNALLQPIEIGETRFTVVGVLEARAPVAGGARGFDSDRAVLLPEGSAVGNLAALEPLPGGSPPGRATATRPVLRRGAEPSLLGPVAAISLLLGGAALASAMFATVVERSGEIALRRVVGATRGELFGELVLESILVSTGGGLAGIVAALALEPGLARGTGGAPAWEVPAALALAALVGAAAGLGPALRAARLDPLEALRPD